LKYITKKQRMGHIFNSILVYLITLYNQILAAINVFTFSELVFEAVITDMLPLLTFDFILI